MYWGRLLDVLEKEYKRTPVLFIDGVDLLVKADKKVYDRLITLAKVMANSNDLRIVLVSSEGAMMPMLEGLSAANRAIIYEVKKMKDFLHKLCVPRVVTTSVDFEKIYKSCMESVGQACKSLRKQRLAGESLN